jgi:hypothetical protein
MRLCHRGTEALQRELGDREGILSSDLHSPCLLQELPDLLKMKGRVGVLSHHTRNCLLKDKRDDLQILPPVASLERSCQRTNPPFSPGRSGELTTIELGDKDLLAPNCRINGRQSTSDHI